MMMMNDASQHPRDKVAGRRRISSSSSSITRRRHTLTQEMSFPHTLPLPVGPHHR